MNRWDVIFLLGVGLLAIGAGMLLIPAGVIVVGIGLIVFAIIGAQGEPPPVRPTTTPPAGGQK